MDTNNNQTNFTDAQMYDLEITSFELRELINEKFEMFDFSELIFNHEKRTVLIKHDVIKDLAVMDFESRIQKVGDDILISFDLFKIMRHRFFRKNEFLSLMEL